MHQKPTALAWPSLACLAWLGTGSERFDFGDSAKRTFCSFRISHKAQRKLGIISFKCSLSRRTGKCAQLIKNNSCIHIAAYFYYFYGFICVYWLREMRKMPISWWEIIKIQYNFNGYVSKTLNILLLCYYFKVKLMLHTCLFGFLMSTNGSRLQLKMKNIMTKNCIELHKSKKTTIKYSKIGLKS